MIAARSIIVVGVKKNGARRTIRQFGKDDYDEAADYALSLPMDGFDDIQVERSPEPFRGYIEEPRRPFRANHRPQMTLVYDATGGCVAQLFGSKAHRKWAADLLCGRAP